MSSVFLSDLDDYLAPSQACVNPVFATPEPTNEPVKLNMSLAYEGISLPQPVVEPDLIKKTGTKATVSLNDCLACR